jgi:LCP family protein required for cell wall assembly
MIIAILGVLCLAIFAGVFAAASVSQELAPALTEDGEGIHTDARWGRRVNILVLGRDGDAFLTDTMMLFQIDTRARTVKVLSIPRDTRVNYNGSNIKINSAYGFRGREQSSITAVRNLTGLPIHYYVSMNLDGFVEIIDYFGGVLIDVPRRMYYHDPYQNLLIDLQPGLQRLNGNQAEQFVRYRSGYAQQDIGRIQAQQMFVQELAKQQLTLSNLTRSRDIFAELSKYINTNLSLGNIASLANRLRGMDTSEISTFYVEGTDNMIGGISYWIADEEALQELLNIEFR